MVSVVAISLNLKHAFLGRTLLGSLGQPMNMALIQVAAKLQEMLIVASLAALVMQVIRDEMMHGDGVPLGLIGGGFQFASLSYFWSPEFWGSIGPGTRFKRRCRLWGLLSLTGLIAAFASPSTAVLLIPRIQEWDAGGSEFYLPNPPAEIWPDKLTFDSDGSDAFCALPNATDLVGCPSSGYNGIRNWMQGMVYSAATEPRDNNLGENMFNCQEYLTFGNSHEIIPDSVMVGNMRSRSCETSLSTAHLATAIT